MATRDSTLNQRIALQAPWKAQSVGLDYQGYHMAMAYCRLTEELSSKSGTKPEKELRCLERALENGFSKDWPQKRIHLIDLGTGNGQKMIPVIEALNRAGIRAVRYLPVDKNPYMSRYAILTILGSGKRAWNRQEVEILFGPLGDLDFVEAQDTDSMTIETLVRLSMSHATRSDLFVREEVVVPMTGLEIDFFQDLPKVASAARTLNGKGSNCFCMLGNTFGNYSPQKQKVFLASLYSEMEAGDFFLLGVGLRPTGKRFCSEAFRFVEREYLPGEAFMRLGADCPQSKYCPKYDPASCCVIHSFERPDQSMQEMGYSYLFDATELVNDLDAAGFEAVSCESYPSLSDRKAPSESENEPQYLTILVRKSQA
jgi:hypothetical protein